jgi:hypothetical protein
MNLFFKLSTNYGVFLDLVSLCPNYPLSLKPHEYTSPVNVTNTEWCKPQAVDTTCFEERDFNIFGVTSWDVCSYPN